MVIDIKLNVSQGYWKPNPDSKATFSIYHHVLQIKFGVYFNYYSDLRIW
jgi:hypothetical protein